MKTCTKCGIEKPLDDFGNKRGKKTPTCKQCFNEYYRSYFQQPETHAKQMQRIKANNKLYLEERREFVISVLHVGCKDCGEKDFRVLEFDHLPEFAKSGGINKIIANGTLKQLKEEIAKCEVVCANCHRKRTYSRGGSYKALAWERIGAIL